MQIKVLLKWKKNKVVCICKGDFNCRNKSNCECDFVHYHQYNGIKEAMYEQPLIREKGRLKNR